jgi:hypothetical protein
LSQASKFSIEHVLVESCDDLIAKENDELKQEVEKFQRELYVLKEKNKVQPSQDNREDMVKKLENGSIVASSTSHQHAKTHKHKIQEKSKVGHTKIQHHPTKHKAQESLSKKPRSSNKWRVCYKCREKGHFADATQIQQWAVALTMTGQTGACHRSNRCRPGLPPL